jgi:predicted nucleic acid-binding protein
LVVLTRQPVQDRTFETREALGALQLWTTGCRVLEENESVLRELLSLAGQFEVRGKQIHDCNIVATMRANGIARLATRNSSDFKRYASLITVDAIG